MLKSLVQELEETFPNHIHIYTDGFQTPNVSGYAVTGNRLNNSTKLHLKIPIFQFELNAIEHAIKLTSIDQNKNITIFSDSINAISSIQNPWTNDQVIQECQELYIKSTNRNNTVTVTWVPAHIGHFGNERVDKLSKEAANSPHSNHYSNSLPEKTTLHLLKKKTDDNWNKNWKSTFKPRQKIVKNDFFKKSIARTLGTTKS